MGPGGVINEFLADIFAVDFQAEHGTENWTIGEFLSLPVPQAPLRDLATPANHGFDRTRAYARGSNDGQPARMADFVTKNDAICRGDGDDCVHFNSGIPAHACYLASVGGPGIDAIGRRRVAVILYSSTSAMTPKISLKTLPGVVAKSCAGMVNEGKATQHECNQLLAAFRAVGL